MQVTRNWFDYRAAVHRAIIAEQPRGHQEQPRLRVAAITQGWEQGDYPETIAWDILRAEGHYAIL